MITKEEIIALLKKYYALEISWEDLAERLGGKNKVHYYLFMCPSTRDLVKKETKKVNEWFAKELEKNPFYVKEYGKPDPVKKYPAIFVDFILNQVELHKNVEVVAEKYGISPNIVHRWRNKRKDENTAEKPLVKYVSAHVKKARKVLYNILNKGMTFDEALLTGEMSKQKFFRVVCEANDQGMGIIKYAVKEYGVNNTKIPNIADASLAAKIKGVYEYVDGQYNTFIDEVLNHLIKVNGHISQVAETFNIDRSLITAWLKERRPDLYNYFVNTVDNRNVVSKPRFVRMVLAEKEKNKKTFTELSKKYNINCYSMRSAVFEYLKREESYIKGFTDAFAIK